MTTDARCVFVERGLTSHSESLEVNECRDGPDKSSVRGANRFVCGSDERMVGDEITSIVTTDFL